jgi:hypothetical protein
MRITKRTMLLAMSGLAVLSVVLAALAVFHGGSVRAASGTIRGIALAGTGSPQSGDVPPSGTNDATQVEFADGPQDANPTVFPAMIATHSVSPGVNGLSTNSSPQAKSNPTFNRGFEGLNHYQQRYSNKGNQFSIEPPDQGMCMGNGRVVETINDVFNVFDTSGHSVLPDNTSTNVVAGFARNVNHAVDLNSFYGYPAAINRTTGAFGPEITDPSCLFDAATQRFFMIVLTLDRVGTTARLSHVNHLDLAVSQTSDPAGQWNIYKVDVTNDGSNPDPSNACPCLGDYPHIGADDNGIYLTTNSYPWNGNGFDGAQIYAFSKAQLAAGAATVTMAHIDTFGAVKVPSDAGSTQPGFTVWPAQSPGTQFAGDNSGTEYFMSSNAADEAQRPVSGTPGTRTSNQIIVWTLSNTESLDGSPSLSLSNSVLSAEQYAFPPAQKQPGWGTAPGADVPQGHCLNDSTTVTIAGTGCWKLLVGSAAHAGGGPEVISRPDANDTRMQQVMYANGKLWGALDTALNPDSGPTRAGIAYFILDPQAGEIVVQGYLGTTGYDLTYPAIGVTESGRGVMAFTATSDTNTVYPSAAYAAIDALVGVSAWNIVPGGQGQADDDGFTGYKQQRFPNRIRPRWGDFGAAAVDGNSIWIASEYIATACDYTIWGGPFFANGTGDNLLGTCAGASHGPGHRTALANWSTFISNFTP